MTEVIIKKRGRPPREDRSMISCDITVKKKQKGISSAADDHYDGFNINAEDSSIIKARNDKLGEKIVALQQLVSPFGKTDTASVLQEALGYIKFLQDQVQVLCSPYMHGSSDHGQWQEPELRPLRSKGLCLVPTAHTMSIAHSNGADMWAPVMGSSGRSRKALR